MDDSFNNLNGDVLEIQADLDELHEKMLISVTKSEDGGFWDSAWSWACEFWENYWIHCVVGLAIFTLLLLIVLCCFCKCI